jgi:hypothetical protein
MIRTGDLVRLMPRWPYAQTYETCSDEWDPIKLLHRTDIAIVLGLNKWRYGTMVRLLFRGTISWCTLTVLERLAKPATERTMPCNAGPRPGRFRARHGAKKKKGER